jgi:hypothetical protein
MDTRRENDSKIPVVAPFIGTSESSDKVALELVTDANDEIEYREEVSYQKVKLTTEPQILVEEYQSSKFVPEVKPLLFVSQTSNSEESVKAKPKYHHREISFSNP